jgi:hypothetical protein
MSSTRAFLLDCFLQTAKLTIAFSCVGQAPLEQFIMDNPIHIPPDAHGRPERGVSPMSKLPCLKRSNHFRAVLSAIVFSVDGTNVSGGLCSFGASIELVKKKVWEKFNFLNFDTPQVWSRKFRTIRSNRKINKRFDREKRKL